MCLNYKNLVESRSYSIYLSACLLLFTYLLSIGSICKLLEIQKLLCQHTGRARGVCSVLMPSKYQPDYSYLRRVPLTRVHLFTAIQIACFSVLWFIQASTSPTTRTCGGCPSPGYTSSPPYRSPASPYSGSYRQAILGHMLGLIKGTVSRKM